MVPLTKFTAVGSDRLFYDQYRYCMTAGIDEVTCLRRLDHKYIDHVLNVRKKYSAIGSWVPSRGRSSVRITDETVANLHKLCDVLTAVNHKFKLVVEFGNMRLYTNDCALFDEIAASDVKFNFVHFKQAVIDRPRNSVKLKNPRHLYRSYLSQIKLSDQEKRAIVRFLQNNSDSLRLSPCLSRWTTESFKWVYSHYFIDYNDHSNALMLNLIRPGLIKKTVDILKA